MISLLPSQQSPSRAELRRAEQSELAPRLQLIQIYSTTVQGRSEGDGGNSQGGEPAKRGKQIKHLRKQLQSLLFADIKHSYSNVIINVVNFPPKALFLSHQQTSSRLHLTSPCLFLTANSEFLQRWEDNRVSDALISSKTLQHRPDKPPPPSSSAHSSLFELICSITSDLMCAPINEQQSRIPALSHTSSKKSSTGETERLSASSFQHEMNQLAEESI